MKDSKRFSNEPGYWAYFMFSHESPPYPAKAKRQPTGACNTCHQANSAEDWVFTQYYSSVTSGEAEIGRMGKRCRLPWLVHGRV